MLHVYMFVDKSEKKEVNIAIIVVEYALGAI